MDIRGADFILHHNTVSMSQLLQTQSDNYSNRSTFVQSLYSRHRVRMDKQTFKIEFLYTEQKSDDN